jgi:hypothetical protein
MPLSVPQPGKAPPAQTALTSTIGEFKDPSLGNLAFCNRKRKYFCFGTAWTFLYNKGKYLSISHGGFQQEYLKI